MNKNDDKIEKWDEETLNLFGLPNLEEIKYREKMLRENPDEWYKCDNCESIYKRKVTDEEMIKEYSQNFPNDPKMKFPRAILCDDCYKKVKVWLNNLTPEERKEIEKEILGGN